MNLKVAFLVVAICGFEAAMAELINNACPTTHTVQKEVDWNKMTGWWYGIKQSDSTGKHCAQLDLTISGDLLKVTRYRRRIQDGVYWLTNGTALIPKESSKDKGRVQLFFNRSPETGKDPDAYFEVLHIGKECAIIYICHPINPNLSYEATFLMSRRPKLSFNSQLTTSINSVLTGNDLENLNKFHDIIQDCGKIDPGILNI